MARDIEAFELRGLYYTMIMTAKDEFLARVYEDVLSKQPDYDDARSTVGPSGDPSDARMEYYMYFRTAQGMQALLRFLDSHYPEFYEEDSYFFDEVPDGVVDPQAEEAEDSSSLIIGSPPMVLGR